MDDGTLYFRVNAELKDVVGRDLINDDNIAVIELVKNSYDAGSPSCSITFIDEEQSDLTASSIIIQDFGHGMSKDDIENKWLNIAYSEKKNSPSREKRKLAGNKGVGRFSCDRLGQRLKLFSRKKNSPSYAVLDIDWRHFEGKGKDVEISAIPVHFEEIPEKNFKKTTGIAEFEQGTILQIYPLRVTWDRSKLLSLRRSLERFINPHQEYDANAFTISITAQSQDGADRKSLRSREKVNGEIQNVIFQELGLRTSYIVSEIDAWGKEITTSLYHRGDRLFTLKEFNKFSLLKGIKITAYFLNQYNKAYFHKETGIPAIEYGSVFLFLNGFRVPPLGERGNDWLGLDSRKAQGTQRYLGTRDIMGRIEISDPDYSWRIISSREGIVHTDAYYELTDSHGDNASYFYSILRKLERYIVDGLHWDSTVEKWHEINEKILTSNKAAVDEKYKISEKEKNFHVIQALQEIVRQGTKIENIISLELDPSLITLLAEQESTRNQEFIREFSVFADSFETQSQLDSNRKLKNFLGTAKAELEKMHKEREAAKAEAKAANQKLDKSEKDKEILREENLFLKAQKNKDIDDVINLHHQVVTWGQIISKSCDNVISKSKKKGQLSQNDVMDAIARIKLQANKILKVAKLATNANFKVKAVAIENNIVSFISDYVKEISKTKIFKDININFISEVTQPFITRFTPIEITIFIDSLISNSKKANSTLFNISIRHSSETEELHIMLDDNGVGLSPNISDADTIFSRGITTTDGSGIGLHHASNIAKSLGGDLTITESKMGGFALLLRLPQ